MALWDEYLAATNELNRAKGRPSVQLEDLQASFQSRTEEWFQPRELLLRRDGAVVEEQGEGIGSTSHVSQAESHEPRAETVQTGHVGLMATAGTDKKELSQEMVAVLFRLKEEQVSLYSTFLLLSPLPHLCVTLRSLCRFSHTTQALAPSTCVAFTRFLVCLAGHNLGTLLIPFPDTSLPRPCPCV